MIQKRFIIYCLSLCISLLAPLTESVSHAEALQDLTELSIEELADIEVTTVSRTPQKLSQSAAAIFVITRDEIRRSGATSIPEALRMAPGIHVARISSDKWAVTSRGFNSRYANKLLVQLDGKTMYSPLFSGVFWESQDTFLEDIERIEIIRGPGASLWGANAVNGIINIITRHSSQTQGALAYGGAGSWDNALAGIRYGDTIADTGNYRVFTQYASHDETVHSDGSDAGDDWQSGKAGFRTDMEPFPDGEVTIQGDFYKGKINEVSVFPTLTAPYSMPYEAENDMSGHYLLGRLSRQFSSSSDMAVQLYYDNTRKEESSTEWTGDILDMDVQHRFVPVEGHELVWGFGYRYYQDDIDYDIGFRFSSDSEDSHLFSTFFQDTITLSPSLNLILGAKLEHNDYTGFEFQPNGRVSWSPGKSHHLWTALSRAVRTPSRADSSIRFITSVIPPGTPENPGPLPAAVTLSGNDNVTSEDLTALEAGYRVLLRDNLSLDSTAYYYWYRNLSSFTPGSPFMDTDNAIPYMVMPLDINNMLDGNTWGFELTANWKPVSLVRFQAAYTWIGMDFKSGPQDALATENGSPDHQISVRASSDITRTVELDVWLRYVDDILEKTVNGYSEVDIRVGWKPFKSIELSLTGQNLLDKRHPEFIETFLWSYPTEVRRSVYGKISYSL